MVQIDLLRTGPEHAHGVVQILGPTGQDLHRHQVLDGGNRHPDAFEHMELGTVEELLLDPRTGQHHVNGQPCRGVDERQHPGPGDEIIVAVTRSRKPFASITLASLPVDLRFREDGDVDVRSQPSNAMEDCGLRTEQIPANTQGIEAGTERGEYLTDVRRHARHGRGVVSVEGARRSPEPSPAVGHSGLIRRACSHKARDASTVATEPRSLNSAAHVKRVLHRSLPSSHAQRTLSRHLASLQGTRAAKGRFCSGAASPENIQLPPDIDSVSAQPSRLDRPGRLISNRKPAVSDREPCSGGTGNPSVHDDNAISSRRRGGVGNASAWFSGSLHSLRFACW